MLWFQKWPPFVILDLLDACLDHPQWVLGSLYRCAKFGWNRWSSSDSNYAVSIFCALVFKMPIRPLKWVLGQFTTCRPMQWGPSKAHPCMQRKHVIWRKLGRRLSTIPRKLNKTLCCCRESTMHIIVRVRILRGLAEIWSSWICDL